MDSTLITLSDARELEEQLKTVQSHLIPVSPNPVDLAWGSDRPQRSHDALFIHTIKYAGEAYQDKLNKVHKYLFEKKYFGVIVSALDEIAWLFNLRGSDVDCSPVFYAYALITQTEATLYVQQEKLTEAVHQHLQGVQLKPYDAIFDELKTVQLTDGQKICIDENTSMAIALAIGLVNIKKK
jgi:Xaa-Pro aminopeptidase